MSAPLYRSIIRVVAGLLMLLSVVHLVATPHIGGVLSGASARVQDFAEGPLVLNHVIVGMLLIPLAISCWISAVSNLRPITAAAGLLIVNDLAVLMLPVAVMVFMGKPAYFRAPLFVTGVGIAGFVAILLTAATIGLLRSLLREQAWALRS